MKHLFEYRALRLSTLALCGLAVGGGCNRGEDTTVVQTPVVENKTVIVNNPTPTPAKKVVVVAGPEKEVKIVKEKHTTIIEKAPRPSDGGDAAPAPSSDTKTDINIAASPEPGTPRPKATPRATTAPRPGVTPRVAMRPPPAPTRQATPAGTTNTTSSGSLVVEAEVEENSKVPEPRSVAYAESVVFTRYKVISVERGSYEEKEIVAVQWGMKNRKLQPAARLRPGQSQRLTLQPFEEKEDLQSIMQNDTLNSDLTPYWVVSTG